MPEARAPAPAVIASEALEDEANSSEASELSEASLSPPEARPPPARSARIAARAAAATSSATVQAALAVTGQVDRALPWADAMDKNALARLLQHVAERAEYDPFPPGILDGLRDLERDLIDAICGAINMNGDADVYHNEISDLRAEIESLRSSRDGYRQALEDTLGRLERAAADARAAATASENWDVCGWCGPCPAQALQAVRRVCHQTYHAGGSTRKRGAQRGRRYLLCVGLGPGARRALRHVHANSGSAWTRCGPGVDPAWTLWTRTAQGGGGSARTRVWTRCGPL